MRAWKAWLAASVQVQTWVPPSLLAGTHRKVAPARWTVLGFGAMADAGETQDPAGLERLRTTRLGLQAVAEQVLAPALYAATGHIGLRATIDGFGTPWFDDAGARRRVRIEGLDLVVERDDDLHRTPLTSVAVAADRVGVKPGVPAGLYPPATPLTPGSPLDLDPAAAGRLAGFYAAVDQALVAFGHEQPDDPGPAQLWPEHFDLALPVNQVNYGGSPGDADHPEPYLYVGPWSPPPDGEFWNATFGAVHLAPADITSADALSFFREGFSRLGGGA